MNKTLRTSLPIAAVAVAMVGLTPIMPTACTQVYVDANGRQVSGYPSTQQAVDVVEAIGDAAPPVALALGHPEWAVIADVVIRLAALAVAWLWPPPKREVLTVSPSPSPPHGTAPL